MKPKRTDEKIHAPRGSEGSRASSSQRIGLLFATSGHSGVDRVIANLMPEFGKSELEFDLLTIAHHGPYLEELPDNVRHVPLNAAHKDTVFPALMAYMFRNRPAALLSANHRLNRAALAARGLSGLPCRVIIRFGMSLRALSVDLGPARGRQLTRSMRFWYSRADAAIAPSEGVSDDLRRIAGVERERLHVICNPIVTDGLAELAAAPIEHPISAWFVNSAVPVILGAGALEPRKDFETLVRAFARIRKGRNVRLVIVGEGSERTRLQQLAEDLGVAEDFWLPGHMPNPYAYMARATVFALCSRREGSGAVLVEALACGTPAVATDCPSGPSEILERGRFGSLIPVGDAEALADALANQLAAAPSEDFLRESISRFDARSAARKYLEVVSPPDARP